jgi:hypothetical protein
VLDLVLEAGEHVFHGCLEALHLRHARLALHVQGILACAQIDILGPDVAIDRSAVRSVQRRHRARLSLLIGVVDLAAALAFDRRNAIRAPAQRSAEACTQEFGHGLLLLLLLLLGAERR